MTKEIYEFGREPSKYPVSGHSCLGSIANKHVQNTACCVRRNHRASIKPDTWPGTVVDT